MNKTDLKDIRDILNITYAPMKEKVLMAAIKLKVFDHLTEPKTAKEVSTVLDSHEINTELFLNTLATIGLIKKINSKFSNNSLTEDYFVSDKDMYLGDFIYSLTSTWHVISLKQLMTLIQNGPAGPVNMVSESIWEKSTRVGANYQHLGMAQNALSVVSELPEYARFNKMLDLGGGAGMVAINLVKNHGNMSGVVFDQPAVTKVTKEFIYKHHMSERMQVISGNYLKDDIGSGYDLVWASFTLNFHQNDMNKIISKIYNSLNKDGIFIYCGDGLTNELTAPEEPIIGMFKACLMAASPLNMPRGKVAQKMIDCGFKSVRSKTTIGSFGAVDIDIARK